MTINEYREARLSYPYVGALLRHGWEWTMALIDEDIVLHGEEDNHEAARRGLRERVQNDHTFGGDKSNGNERIGRDS